MQNKLAEGRDYSSHISELSKLFHVLVRLLHACQPTVNNLAVKLCHLSLIIHFSGCEKEMVRNWTS